MRARTKLGPCTDVIGFCKLAFQLSFISCGFESSAFAIALKTVIKRNLGRVSSKLADPYVEVVVDISA